jgi:predicted O-methyltransferase YrrM
MVNILTQEVKDHIANIANILDTIGEQVEGNLICDITSDNLTDERNESKISNLLKLAKGKSKICEIGVNAGHSLLLMVSSNPTAEYLLFDLGGHGYTRPCVEYIRNAYPSTKITEVYGDSNLTLRSYVATGELNTFDLIHVDGGHETHTVVSDFIYTQFLLKKNGIIVFDDYNFGNIKEVIDYYINKEVITKYEIDTIETDLHYIYKLND